MSKTLTEFNVPLDTTELVNSETLVPADLVATTETTAHTCTCTLAQHYKRDSKETILTERCPLLENSSSFVVLGGTEGC